jgi:TolB-like protein/DNA-binding winged helix-turn-helix (wHTH) protein/Tfp pilus assembly protein PilF
MEPSMPGAADPDYASYQVGDLVVDIGQQRVTRAGAEIPLPRLSFELLLALTRAAPNLVTFDQLTERVWPGLVITPETISQRIKLVRAALGDDTHSPRYIAGIRGRGYRMVAEVQPLTERRRPTLPVTPYWEADTAVPAPDPGNDAAPVPMPVVSPVVAAAPGTFAWVGAAFAILLLIAVPWTLTHYLRAPKPEVPNTADSVIVVQPARTIAVLPLADMSPGGGNSYLGDGLAQALSARLGRIRGLRVASRTSVSSLSDRGADVHTIAQRLGVRHILEGSVQREGDQLRVTATLIDASTGYNLWSHTYNRTWQDLLTIEDDLARSIMDTLKVVLTSDLAQRSPQVSPAQLAAFDPYLRGLAMLYVPGTHLDEAGEDFKQALAQDPNFALAYAGLCERYVRGYERSRDATLVPQAEAACARALELDGSLSEVTAALAHLYQVMGRNTQAEALYRDALRRDPDNADNHIGLAEALDGEHRTADAERSFRQAIEVEPSWWYAHTALGNFLFRHGRPTEAAASYRRVAQLIPGSYLAFNNLGAALEMEGDFQGAAQAYERSLALEPTRSGYSNLGTDYYFLGRQAEAVRAYTRATELAPEDHRVWGNLADALWQTEGGQAQAQKDYLRAAELAQRGLEVEPKDAVSWMQLAYYRARAGEVEHIERYTERALAQGSDDPNVQYYAALIALQRSDVAGALDALTRAVGLGYPVQLVGAAPDFVSLRSDARFRKLLTPPAKASQV